MESERVGERLLWSLLLASLVLNALYAALAGVLVPALLADADEANKETNLAVVMTASSLVTLIVHPLAGAWSDRTRSRWGRRTPWMVGGAVVSVIAMAGLGSARTVVAVGVGWLLVQPLLNIVEAALDAVLPDRVPADERSRASARYGAGAAAGLGLGAVVAGMLIGTPLLLTVLLGVVFLVTMVGFVVANPEPAANAVESAMPLRDAWGSRNLRLVFAGRLVMVLGSQLVLGYLLYIVMEFTGRDTDGAAKLVPLLVGIHLAALAVGAFAAVRWSGSRRVSAVIGATVIVVVGLAIPLAFPTLAGLVGYAVVSGLGRGAYLTADVALMLDVLPSTGNHGRDFGVLGMATVLPQTLAPSLAGILLAVTGDTYTVIFLTAVIAALASIPFVARVQLPEGADLVDGSPRV